MSYSDIVNKLQGDEVKGVRMLMEKIELQKAALQNIKMLEEQLNLENQAYNSRIQDMKNICEHLKKQPPFIITENDKVYQLSHDYQVQLCNADYHF